MTRATSAPAIGRVLSQELSEPDVKFRTTTSLHERRSPLTVPRLQLARLAAVDLAETVGEDEFDPAAVTASGAPLRAGEVEIFQVNLGRLCNMTCRHCHVDAGPDRWEQMMDRETVEQCLRLLDRTGAHTVDITGGAPELNPSFRFLVEQAVARGKHVIDRCNLTVLLLPRCRDLPEWLGDRGVEVVCSLPHIRRKNTDAMRGEGAFQASLEALGRLNAAGYGTGDHHRRLTLMVNPVGAFLCGDQAGMEKEWKRSLEREHQITFDRLIALNNMPIARYLEWLESKGMLERYMELMVRSFNPATVAGLMCRNTISISWQGKIFDCDFNQMLELPTRVEGCDALHVSDCDPAWLAGREIVTARHCFGCTAGAGSSCGGALDE